MKFDVLTLALFLFVASAAVLIYLSATGRLPNPCCANPNAEVDNTILHVLTLP